MSRDPKKSQSSLPAPPTVAIPGTLAVVGVVAAWLAADPLVIRAGATVVAVAVFVGLFLLTRYLRATLPAMATELRARSLDLDRMREAMNQVLDQIGTQRDEMARMRDEAAALLEFVETHTGVDALTGAFNPPTGPVTGPLPGEATPSGASESRADDVPGPGTGEGYLQHFSLDDDDEDGPRNGRSWPDPGDEQGGDAPHGRSPLPPLPDPSSLDTHRQRARPGWW